MSSAVVEYDFPDFKVKGTAIAFTTDSFARYVDEHLRNADDATHGVMVRHAGDGYEELEKACRSYPLLPSRLVDVLVEDAGFARASAVLVEPLNDETPNGVLRLAGLSVEEAARLRTDAGPAPQLVVIVRNASREKLFACVLRSNGESVAMLTEERKKGRGYGKACVSAAMGAMVWHDKKPEEAFERYPAIPALALAEHIVELGGVAAARTFRRR